MKPGMWQKSLKGKHKKGVSYFYETKGRGHYPRESRPQFLSSVKIHEFRQYLIK